MAAAGGAGRGRGGKGEGSLAYRAWREYLLQLQQHPLRTKMITAGCLAGVSDSVAQKLSGYQKIEKRRLFLKMLFGFAYGGPFGHFLHKILDYIFQGKKDTKTIAKKVLLEQVTSSPWNNLLFLFYYGYVVEGYNLKNDNIMITNMRSGEAFEGGEAKGEETISFGAIECLDVLANCRLDKPYVHAFAIPCDLPQFCRLLLGDISQPSHKGYVFEAGLDGLG
ncbi:unnamed protein product [Urochloa decumbens]|uniref:Peroxisomal membrane protein PMP22 n=1 Tax=Urochloa decumbens TaxID=240449 RepID=A0ABC9A1A7_9POAL